MTTPTIDQLRRALRALGEKPSILLPSKARRHLGVLLRHAAASVAAHDREQAEEDRVERGMLASLCEVCDGEIAAGSDYGVDIEHGVYCCAACAAGLSADAYVQDGEA